TISAPLASMARRVSAKSLYFPVPTMRRERNVRSPRENVSSMISSGPRGRPVALSRCGRWTAGSAAADELHDLELVAGREPRGRVLVARHDVAVALDGDPALAEAELVQQVGDGDAVADVARLAVQPDLHSADDSGAPGRLQPSPRVARAVFTPRRAEW